MTKEELIHQIALALEDGSLQHYLDILTLQVIQLNDSDYFDEDRANIAAAPDRYLLIDRIQSPEIIQLMESFARSVRNQNLQSLLLDALSGSRPFNDFREMLMTSSDELDRWYRFKDIFFHDKALEWLVEKYIPRVNP